MRKNQDLVSILPLTISAQYGLIDQNEFLDKRIASKDISNYFLVKNGEFAYNKSTSNDAPWGAIKRLDRYENGVLSTLYIVFGIRDKNKIDSNFLVSYYDPNLWHKGIHEIAAEGARNHGLLNIAPADFFNTKLTIPQNIEEQKKIGKYFRQLDSLITLHQRKLKEKKNNTKVRMHNYAHRKKEKERGILLNIQYGNMENVIFNTSVYFRNVYEDEWITDPLAVAMIADVDHSTVVAGGVIDSPVLGKIPPTSLSGGVKTLILIDNMPDKIFNATNCGDNCAKWLLKIAEKKDVTINLRYLMDFGDGNFDIHVLNTNETVHTMDQLMAIAIEHVYQEVAE